MRQFLFSVALCVALFVAHAGHAQQIAGRWSGRADLGASRLRLVFHIESSDTGYSALMDSPDHGAVGIPASSVGFERDTLRLAISSIGFAYTGVLKGDRIEGSFTQMGRRFGLDLEREDSGIAGSARPLRPQEPRPPFPYRVEEVVFNNPAAGIHLAGTLTMPQRPAEGGGFPAVVLLTGSGAQNRDEELFGHKPFLVLADHLTRRGIAVLRFDDRGVGGSGGTATADDTTADFATDAAAALDHLRTRPGIDPAKTGFAGHSEGALIAFMAAAAHPGKTAFVISMAGPGLRGEEISVMQVADIMAARGLDSVAVSAAARKQRHDLARFYALTAEQVEASLDSVTAAMVPGLAALPDQVKEAARKRIVASNSPWARFFMSHDPADDLARVKCPVLALNGDKDRQVRSSVNLPAIRTALEAAGDPAFTAIEYPDLNHLFQTCATGGIEEYGEISETISPRVMDDIAAWILRVTGDKHLKTKRQ